MRILKGMTNYNISQSFYIKSTKASVKTTSEVHPNYEQGGEKYQIFEVVFISEVVFIFKVIFTAVVVVVVNIVVVVFIFEAVHKGLVVVDENLSDSH